MPELRPIATADLLLDNRNPRLIKPGQGQRNTIRELASTQGRKLRALARDIVVYGLNPAEVTLVMETSQDRYIVLEGNRRLAAIRALENPDLIAGAAPQHVLRAMRDLSEEYLNNPIAEIMCVVVDNRSAAHHWLEVRHGGEQGGAGLTPWGAQERGRFLSRSTGQATIDAQALEFLQKRGDLDQDERSKVATTTYRRLLGTPEVRAKLGIEWANGRMQLLADEERVARALLHVARDIITKKIRVKDVYRTQDRIDYGKGLPKDIVVTPAVEPKQRASTGTAAASGKRKRRRQYKPRNNLIPKDCDLTVAPQRLRDIEQELRDLELEKMSNAVSVLFRVFMELTANAYIETHHTLQRSEDKSLGAKLNAVTEHLVQQDKITDQQAVPVRRAAQADSFLGPSIKTMHQWVHNTYMAPEPGDMRKSWDNLQPWFEAIWSA